MSIVLEAKIYKYYQFIILLENVKEIEPNKVKRSNDADWSIVKKCLTVITQI